MNTKKLTCLGYVLLSLFAISTATAAGRMGHAGPMMQAGHGSSARFAPTMRNSGAGFHRFNNGGFDRFGRFHHFRDRDFVFIDTFGFPFYPFPYYGYYPYDYYPYGYYPSDYYGDSYYQGSGYGYRYGDRSSVTAEQRQLARAGYYHGAIDGIMGPQTRRAIRAYERDHNTAGNSRY